MLRNAVVPVVLSMFCLGCSSEFDPPENPSNPPAQTGGSDPKPNPTPIVDDAMELETVEQLVDANDHEKSLLQLTEHLQTHPHSVPAYFRRGQLLSDQMKFEAAIEDFNKALAENPTHYGARIERAACYRGIGKEDAALEDCKAIIDRLTKYGTHTLDTQGERELSAAYALRADLFHTRKQYETAVQEFTFAIELNPEAAALRAFRGESYLKLRDCSKAREDIDQALQLDPERVAILYAKVKLEDHPDCGNPEAAREWVDKLLVTAPEGSPSHYLGLLVRGRARLREMRYSEGLADLQKYLETERAYDILNDIAWTLATCPDDTIRDGQKARELAEEAWELSGKQDLYCLGTLAAAHAELGDFAKAIELQELALADVDYVKSTGESAQIRLKAYRNNQPHREP